MSIIKNKDIYDPSQGNPFASIERFLDLLDKKIAEASEESARLEKQLSRVNKTGDGKEAKQLIENTNQLNAATERLLSLQKAQTAIKKQIIDSEAKLVASYESEAEVLRQVKIETQVLNKQKSDASKLASQLIGAYEKESIKLNQLRKHYKDLVIEEKHTTEEGKNLLLQIQQLDAKLKNVDASVGQFQRSVGNYQKALQGVGSELLGAAGITVGIAGIVSAFQNVEQRASELVKINKQVQNTFDLDAESAKSLSSNVLALANNFDKDYKEVLTAANTVSKSFGISGKEALSLIEEGFQKGSDNSGQFIDILKEYPTQFKAAGIDAKTMFAIINQQVKQGIYSDKGADVIKEAGLRLRENTKATQDALKPLDESIKKQIAQEIAAGNSFKAIQLVSKALSDSSLTAQQTQAIIADVFGGPGEDAGLDYIKTLKDIQTNLDGVAKQTSQVQDADLELSKSYNDFVQSVSDGSGVISEAWSDVLNGFSDFLKSLTDINSEQTTFTEKTKAFSNVIEKFIPIIGVFNKALEGQKYGLLSLIPGLERAIDGFKELFNIQSNQSSPLKTNLAESKKQLEDLRAQNKKGLAELERLKKFNESNKPVNNKKPKSDNKKTDDKFKLEIDNYLARNKAANDSKEFIESQEDALTKFEQAENEKRLKSKEENDQAFWDMQVAYAEKMQALRDNELEKEKAFEEERRRLIGETLSFATEQFGNMLAQGELSYKEFGKLILATALDIAEKMILLSIAEIFAKEIAKKSFAGLVTAPVLMGLVKGFFAGIKSQVQSFAQGTDYVQGPGTETSDSIPARLSKGERVVPASINRYLIGIQNRDLPTIVNSGMSTLRMENELSEIKNQLQQSSWYLSNFEIRYEDKDYKYIKDVKTGITHKIVKS